MVKTFLWFGGEGNAIMFSCHSHVLHRPDSLFVVRGSRSFLLPFTGGEGSYDELATVRVEWPCVGSVIRVKDQPRAERGLKAQDIVQQES